MDEYEYDQHAHSMAMDRVQVDCKAENGELDAKCTSFLTALGGKLQAYIDREKMVSQARGCISVTMMFPPFLELLKIFLFALYWNLVDT